MRVHIWKKKQAAAFLLGGFALYIGLVAGIRMVITAAAETKAKQLPIYSVETEKKQLALGINCAWDNSDIPLLLQTLKDADVKATFFIVGDWCEKFPESVKALAEAGHEIGNHSNHHPDMAKLTKEEIIKEINRASDRIEAVTGKRPELFRAPSGSYNNLVIETAKEQGYIPIQWNLDSRDWKGPSPEEMTKRIVSNVQNGSITLFHAGKENTDKALPEIIRQLKEKGYEFVPVGDLIYREHYTIDHTGQQKSLPVLQ